MVRRRLDRPQDILGNVLSGVKRAGDPTYETKIRKVEQQLIRPGMNVRYVLEGLPHVSYARYELQLVPQVEPYPKVHKTTKPLLPLKIHEKKENNSTVELLGSPDFVTMTSAQLKRTKEGKQLLDASK